jgi:hypothetical protein
MSKPGKRERQARKRHKRTVMCIWTADGGRTLKAGCKHLGRHLRQALSVADTEKPGESER